MSKLMKYLKLDNSRCIKIFCKARNISTSYIIIFLSEIRYQIYGNYLMKKEYEIISQLITK